jgi:abortive infection bacteriophage resistance protein
MEYTKPWLSYEEQADLLKKRGLSFNRENLIKRLSEVGYYRLSGYWYIFKQNPNTDNESFIDGADFTRIWDLYTFDRKFKLTVLDAIERVEVYIRTQLAYRLAKISGPFGFLDRPSLPNIDQSKYEHFLSRCFTAYDRSKTMFVAHFKEQYGDYNELPPYWILVNIMDFGMILTLFRGAPDKVKKDIAEDLKVPVEVLDSWLLALNTTRNICAHHDRLWNRRLGNRVKIPRGHRYPEWHKPFKVNNSTTFTLLTILSFLLESIAPSTSWHEHAIRLLSTREQEDLRRMGFSEGWQTCPIWKKWLTNPNTANISLQ